MNYFQAADGKVHAVGLCNAKPEDGQPFPAGKVIWVELCGDCVTSFVKSRERIEADAEPVEVRALQKAAQATEKRVRARPGNPALARNAEKAERMAKAAKRSAKAVVDGEKANAPAE